jgi:hypothetical protein
MVIHNSHVINNLLAVSKKVYAGHKAGIVLWYH